MKISDSEIFKLSKVSTVSVENEQDCWSGAFEKELCKRGRANRTGRIQLKSQRM